MNRAWVGAVERNRALKALKALKAHKGDRNVLCRVYRDPFSCQTSYALPLTLWLVSSG